MQTLRRMRIPRPSQAEQHGWSSSFDLDVQGVVLSYDAVEDGYYPTLLVLENLSCPVKKRRFLWLEPDVSVSGRLLLHYLGCLEGVYLFEVLMELEGTEEPT